MYHIVNACIWQSKVIDSESLSIDAIQAAEISAHSIEERTNPLLQLITVLLLSMATSVLHVRMVPVEDQATHWTGTAVHPAHTSLTNGCVFMRVYLPVT